MSVEVIPLDLLVPHPQNPRLRPREDVIDSIAAQVQEHGFDEAHSLIVRPLPGGQYQIISGHHRSAAAAKAGLVEVPCFVRRYTDLEAMMALVLNNSQSELTPLERALHAEAITYDARSSDAAEGRITVGEYAKQTSRDPGGVSRDLVAAKVWKQFATWQNRPSDAEPAAIRVLYEIGAAPEWLQGPMVALAIAEGWTVEMAKLKAGKVKSLKAGLPPWTDQAKAADAVLSGEMSVSDVERMGRLRAEARVDDPDLVLALDEELERERPHLLSRAQSIVSRHQDEQTERERFAAALAAAWRDEKQSGLERARRRANRLRENCSLEEWETLSKTERSALLEPEDAISKGFNPQKNNDIEWAQWSWNPVTGCEHGCPYCYARVIANSDRVGKFYPNGFKPTFRSRTVFAPRGMKVPEKAKTDVRYRNVFTCSMADLFGRWVPEEWVDAVLDEARSAADWNFLFLTKFPKRMAEFDIPSNAWMGTTVDLQARVKSAEQAFAKVDCSVKWLSVEPMLEPLKFERLDLFDWVVIGGSSRQPATDESPETPDWHPPFDWIVDLYAQARAAGCKVYFKDNLLGSRILEMPGGAPIVRGPQQAPKVFQYLGKGARAA